MRELEVEQQLVSGARHGDDQARHAGDQTSRGRNGEEGALPSSPYDTTRSTDTRRRRREGALNLVEILTVKEEEVEEGDDMADGVKARWCSIRDVEEVVDVGVLLAALAAAGLDGEQAGDEHMLLRSLESLTRKEEGRGDALGWRRRGGKRGTGKP